MPYEAIVRSRWGGRALRDQRCLGIRRIRSNHRYGGTRMRISIVTISFNQAAFLERALESVLRQTHPDVEYIVVDPGSTDGSREIIERYRPRLAAVALEPDSGPADGMNRGF